MNLAAYPRSSAYLAGMGIRPDRDPGLNEYWAAVIVADAALSDLDIERAGLCFDGKVRGVDGAALLAKVETAMRSQVSEPKRKDKTVPVVSDSLQAYLGARGVKTSLLKAEDDWWSCAIAMWPERIQRHEGASLADLMGQIQAMTKKQRQTAQRHLIPQQFRAGGAA